VIAAAFYGSTPEFRLSGREKMKAQYCPPPSERTSKRARIKFEKYVRCKKCVSIPAPSTKYDSAAAEIPIIPHPPLAKDACRFFTKLQIIKIFYRDARCVGVVSGCKAPTRPRASVSIFVAEIGEFAGFRGFTDEFI
jgi:hypothetical protein